ncbi:hypothetical protein B0H13DRAFT_1929288 [Mycena leptocephala]|nr:hypothetical protein B0H13DRAFT_1929288 [Mycena leptocephala]
MQSRLGDGETLCWNIELVVTPPSADHEREHYPRLDEEKEWETRRKKASTADDHSTDDDRCNTGAVYEHVALMARHLLNTDQVMQRATFIANPPSLEPLRTSFLGARPQRYEVLKDKVVGARSARRVVPPDGARGSETGRGENEEEGQLSSADSYLYGTALNLLTDGRFLSNWMDHRTSVRDAAGAGVRARWSRDLLCRMPARDAYCAYAAGQMYGRSEGRASASAPVMTTGALRAEDVHGGLHTSGGAQEIA